MSVPLRYRRHQGLPRSPDAAPEPTAPGQNRAQITQPQQDWQARQQGQQIASGHGNYREAHNGLGLYDNRQYAQQVQAQHYAQQHAQQYAQQYLRYQHQSPSPHHGSHARSPVLQSSGASRSSPSGSPQIQGHSPNLNQQVTRKPRPYNRADRAMGRIVDGYKEPNQEAIDRLIASTAPQNPNVDSESANASVPARQRTRPDAANSLHGECTVTIRLPSRQVIKKVSKQTTAAELIAQLVKEHRLEFEFEHNNEGDGDDVLLWECIEGTRRPLRPSEHVGPVVDRWGKSVSRCYLRTTSTSLRNDVDSLASLVPRRDMLRVPPKIQAADVSFSRPSVMYNSHVNNYVQPQSPPLSPTPDNPSNRGFSGGRDMKDTNNPNGGAGSEHLTRVPSKINPNDKCLVAKRVHADNDDVALQKQLVWGFGSLDLDGGKLTLKQKPGDELVCALNVSFTDIYEWPHTGPKKYNLVLRAQQLNSRSVYLSTDSAKVFNIVRNAVFTARTKELLDQQQRKR